MHKKYYQTLSNLSWNSRPSFKTQAKDVVDCPHEFTPTFIWTLGQKGDPTGELECTNCGLIITDSLGCTEADDALKNN